MAPDVEDSWLWLSSDFPVCATVRFLRQFWNLSRTAGCFTLTFGSDIHDFLSTWTVITSLLLFLFFFFLFYTITRWHFIFSTTSCKHSLYFNGFVYLPNVGIHTEKFNSECIRAIPAQHHSCVPVQGLSTLEAAFESSWNQLCYYFSSFKGCFRCSREMQPPFLKAPMCWILCGTAYPTIHQKWK